MFVLKWCITFTWLVTLVYSYKETLPVSENDPYYEEFVDNLRELQGQFNVTTVEPKSFLNFKTSLKPVDKSSLQRYAKFAAASYCTDLTVKNWVCLHCLALGRQVEVIRIYNDLITGSKAFVALDHGQKTINVVYRGSSNLRNWLTNMQMRMVQYSNINEAKVHVGFLQCANALKRNILPDLRDLIKYHPSYKVSVIGHSLGGAIAAISILEFRQALAIADSKLQLITYGEPRIGNLDFANYFTSQPFPMYRVVHNHDLVPHVPPTAMLFYHRRRMIFIGSNDPYNCDPDNWSDDTCTLGQKLGTSILDHLNYFNTVFGPLC